MIDNTLKLIDKEDFLALPPLNLNITSKEEIKEYYKNTHSLYENLFTGVSNDKGYYTNPDPLRRQLIFYLGHTSAFYINKLMLMNLTSHVKEFFEILFAIGVDPKCTNDLDNCNYEDIWPSLKDIRNYRQEVYNRVLDFIDKNELVLPIKKETPYWVLCIGLEHERVHYETSSVLIRQLDIQYVKPPVNWQMAEYSRLNYPNNEFISIEATSVHLGKPEDFPSYGWDNEYGSVELDIQAFKATKFKISNGEYLEFFNDGGYEIKDNWSEEGWEWKSLENAAHPRFWVKVEKDLNDVKDSKKSKFRYRAMFEILDMPLNWPVEVNYHEAMAYCVWLQNKHELKDSFYRLIKEEEFKVIRADDEVIKDRNLKGVACDFVGFSNKYEKHGNTRLYFGSPSAVDYFPPSPKGFYDTCGNVWEWSVTQFRALPGFKPETYYFDYSGPYFDYYHNQILGSSWASIGPYSSKYVRNAFRRNFYQHCGFRVVEEKKIRVLKENPYESKKIVSEYIITYYYDNILKKNIFNDFPIDIPMEYNIDFGTKIADLCIDYFKKINNYDSNKTENIDNPEGKLRALDLGCGVGKTSFVLGNFFDEVTGIDFSKTFIDICNKLKYEGKLEFEYLKNGEFFSEACAVLDKSIDTSKVNFIHADALNLPSLLGPFDLICAVNLIDRLTNPMQCLLNMRNMLTKQGILVLVSPYTFMEAYTPKKNWIGGGKDGKESFEALVEFMNSICFTLVDNKTVSLYIREHERKFQLCLPHLTIWKKKVFSDEFAHSIFKSKKKEDWVNLINNSNQ